MTANSKVMIGIGSNLEDPVLQVKKALKALTNIPGTEFVRSSSLYTSEPQGPQDQEDFVNAAALVSTTLSPLQLLTELQRIEEQFGRVKTRHWGERIIDLDIVFYDQQIVSIDSPDLEIPHREALNRDFVILPILEIDPQWRLPSGETLKSSFKQSEQFVLNKLES